MDSSRLRNRQDAAVDHLIVLRGIFCVAVVQGHTYDAIGPQEKDKISALLTLDGFSIGWLLDGIAPAAVWGFFILSGYLIGKGFYRGRYSLTAKGLGLYYGNRIKRIFPLYYFIVLVVFVFTAPEIFDFSTQTHKDLLPLLLFYFNMTEPFHIPSIGTAWSLSTEVQFYMIAPFLAFAIFKFCRSARTALPALLVIVTLSALWRWRLCGSGHLAADYWFYHIYLPLWANLEFFLAGFLATPVLESLRSRIGPLRQPWIVRLVGYNFLLTSLVLAAYILRERALGVEWGYVTFMTFLPALLIIATVVSIVIFELCSTSDAPRAKSLPDQIRLVGKHPARLFEIFGTLTFGVYLWHAPILAEAVRHFTKSGLVGHYAELFVTVLAMSVLVAGMSYHFIEYPFDAKKKFA